MPTPPRTRTRVLELLSEGEAITSSELRARLGWPCSSGNVWAVVKKLHTERLIHIDSWKRSYGTKGAMGPRWKLGPGEDAPKPKNDRAADNRRYWHNLDPTLRQHRTQKYKGKTNPFTGLYIHAINQTARPVRKKGRPKNGRGKT